MNCPAAGATKEEIDFLGHVQCASINSVVSDSDLSLHSQLSSQPYHGLSTHNTTLYKNTHFPWNKTAILPLVKMVTFVRQLTLCLPAHH